MTTISWRLGAFLPATILAAVMALGLILAIIVLAGG